MTHHEQAMAQYEAGDYEAALDAFEQALDASEASAALWRDVGRTHIQLEDWESAKAALDEATAMDERDAQAWYAKGNVYQATGDVETALKAYETALLFDPEWGLPWLAKAALSLSIPQRAEDGLRYLKRALHLDAAKAAPHAFAILAQLPPLPFLSYRLIRDQMAPWAYLPHADYVRHTFEMAQPLRAFLSAYEQQKATSHFTVGLLQYYLGDPAAALQAFKAVEAEQEKVSKLQLLYYKIQACYGFAADDEAFLEQALAIAGHYLPPEQSGAWGLFKKKKAAEVPPLPAEEWETCYYAGLVYIENDQLDEALRCFERIEADYLPALYQAMWVYEEKVNTKKKKEKGLALLARESAHPEFSQGCTTQDLTLEAGRFEAQMQFNMRYEELSEAIELLHFFAEFEVDDQEVELPREQPPLYERCTMSDELCARVEQETKAGLQAKIDEDREAITPPPPDPAQAASEEAWYQQLGAWLEQSEADDRQALLHLNALTLQKPLPAEHKIALDGYVFCRGGRAADWPVAIAEGYPFGTGIGMGRYLGDNWGLSGEEWEQWTVAAQRIWPYSQGFASMRINFAAYNAGVQELEEEE